MQKIKIIVLLLLSSYSLFAQQTPRDLQLLKAYTPPSVQPGYNGRIDTVNNRKPIVYKHHNVLLRYNPVSLAFTGAMLFYQEIVSPQLSAGCLYQRTCSNFSKEAIHEFGLIGGVLLSADRLSRCSRSVLREIPAWRIDEQQHVVDEPSQFRRQ